MPFGSRRDRSFPLRSTPSPSSSYGRATVHRRPSPMSESTWLDVRTKQSESGLPGVMPSDFALGPPPDPRPGDAYAAKWLKLVWLETYDAYAVFVEEEKRKASSFSSRAQLRVDVGFFCEKRKLYRVTITGNDPAMDFALPEGVGGADFVHAMLKLRQGSGWVYVRSVDPSEDNGDPTAVTGWGKVYSEAMRTKRDAEAASQLCIPFDAFSACLGRFNALQRYGDVDEGVRGAIEATGVGRGGLRSAMTAAGSEPLLLPVSPQLRTKLNSVQLRIMQHLRTPVDFVQGPPGTGKSTFIVELLQARIPRGSGSKVLLCTTTNKAIDSLAEKLHCAGHRDVVAFGNASRLGRTALTLTLSSHVERHPACTRLAALRTACNRVRQRWSALITAAEERAAAVAQSLESELSNREVVAKCEEYEKMWLESLWRPDRGEWERRLNALVAKVQELVALPGNSPKLTAYLSARSSLCNIDDRTKPLSRGRAPFSCWNTVHSTTQFLRGLQDFLTVTKSPVDALMKLQVLEAARFVVCTAATAVKLASRIRRVLEHLPATSAESDRNPAYTREPGGGSTSAADQLAQSLSGLSIAGPQGSRPARRSATDAEDDSALTAALSGVLRFKYVVLDEAGAMLEPDMVGTVIHGCRFLLCVGDHKQLPPFTTWREAGEYKYNTSLLERLARTAGIAADHNLMTTQYRMPAPLAAIVSDIFYEGALTTPPAVAAARTHPTPAVFIHVPGQEEKQGTSFKNAAEAQRVVRIVREEAAAGRGKARTINVIAFHKPQSFALQRALDAEAVEGDVEVMTVDSMQGREADVVVLSCVRTAGNLGFLANRNRLNVAISRARHVLYIVGDMDTMRAGGSPAWRQLLDHGNMALQIG